MAELTSLEVLEVNFFTWNEVAIKIHIITKKDIFSFQNIQIKDLDLEKNVFDTNIINILMGK